MPNPLAKLHALAAESIAALPGTPGSATWARAFERTLATAHTAAYYAATAERLGVSVGTLKGLSRAERADVKKAVAEQVSYLKKFVTAAPDLSERAVAVRAALYAGSVKATYYAARWGDWEIPSGLVPGAQQCLGNCKCDIAIKDSGDGTGVLTRTMRGTEHHCTECPPLVGDHPVKRRYYETKTLDEWDDSEIDTWDDEAVKHLPGGHDQRSHGRSTGRRAASRGAYSSARASGASVSEARTAARAASDYLARSQRMENINTQLQGHTSDAQRRSLDAELQRLKGEQRNYLSKVPPHLHGSVRDAVESAPAVSATVRGRQAPRANPRQTVLDTEKQIHKQKNETAIVFDQSGNVLFKNDGGKDYVYISDAALAKIKNKDAIFTHNHPAGWEFPPSDPRHNGNSFSWADIDVAMKANVAEIRAVTPTRVYYIRRPEGGWNRRATQKAYDARNSDTRRVFTDAIAKGRMSIAEAEAQHIHKVWSEVSAVINAPYGYEDMR